jgi:YHS domain-containing protein
MTALTHKQIKGDVIMNGSNHALRALRGGLLLVIATLISISSEAGDAGAGEINTGYFGNVAIEGYDSVAYFKEGKAVKGSPEYSYEWFGAEWHFSRPEHRALFKENPLAYSPQYGGLCADGVSYGGMTVNIDPEAFSIIDGKLYLNADQPSREDLESSPSRIKSADAKWPKVKKRFTGN